jgi:hypothetical protein
MTIQQLKRIYPYISIQRICKKAGLSGHAIRARIRRGSTLTEDQQRRLDEAFSEIGLAVEEKEIVDTAQSATRDTSA